MESKEFDDLIKRYLDGTSTEEERDILYLWLINQTQQEQREWLPGEEEEVEKRLRFKLKGLVDDARATHATPLLVRLRNWSAIAASILVLFAVGLWLFQQPVKQTPEVSQQAASAVLHKYPELVIRVDGNDYLIDSLPIGVDSYIGGLAVRKTSSNSLSYLDGAVDDGHMRHEAPVNHRLFVPKGKDFNITLADGSVAWLNTESMLEFPAVFAGSERKVTLSGEAFFEVASDKTHPFKVTTAEGAEVVATGTQFAVKAYHDEVEMYTTLVEGAITMSAEGESLAMRPNQQAVNRYGVSGIRVSTVDVKGIIAKKNGYFAFSKQDISSIMKDVSRWYDVDVYFQGEVSPRLFGGTFSKKRPLSELLEYFESVGNFKFKQKGRRIIVMS